MKAPTATATARMAEPEAHVFHTRVYWEDTDGAGIVFYANYFKFAERARTEMLRAIGIEQRCMLDETGIAFAVQRCACEYLRPARLDDSLAIVSRVTLARGASLDLHQQVRCADAVLAELDVTIVCIGRDGRPARLPPGVRHALAVFTLKTN